MTRRTKGTGASVSSFSLAFAFDLLPRRLRLLLLLLFSCAVFRCNSQGNCRLKSQASLSIIDNLFQGRVYESARRRTLRSYLRLFLFIHLHE